jgi:hypothetical protein
MSDDADAPEVVTDLALGAFRMVKEKLGFELDFTPETLPVLDHYLRDLEGEDGAVDEKIAAVVGPCAGAYFGEVVRRSLPALRWHLDAGDYSRWRLEAANVFFCFNPIGAALEALFGEAVADYSAHFSLLPEDREVVERSLEASGPVREDDYYRLAVRHEAIEQTLSILTGLAEARGEPRRFGPDVYAAAIDSDRADVDA